MSWNNAVELAGSKADALAASEIDKAERDAGKGSTTRPTIQKRTPEMAAHVAGAVAATKRQAPTGW